MVFQSLSVGRMFEFSGSVYLKFDHASALHICEFCDLRYDPYQIAFDGDKMVFLIEHCEIHIG